MTNTYSVRWVANIHNSPELQAYDTMDEALTKAREVATTQAEGKEFIERVNDNGDLIEFALVQDDYMLDIDVFPLIVVDEV